MKKAAILGALAASSIAGSGCSLAEDKTVFLQCVHEPSNFIMEYKIENQKIWSWMENKWKEGSDVKFSKSVITYRDYLYNTKDAYNEYTINRITGVLTMSPDIYTQIKFPVLNMVAKCSIVEGDKLKF